MCEGVILFLIVCRGAVGQKNGASSSCFTAIEKIAMHRKLYGFSSQAKPMLRKLYVIASKAECMLRKLNQLVIATKADY